jgi:N-acetylglucosamine-6-sulfatase
VTLAALAIAAALALAAAAGPTSAPARPPAAPPNVVVIMADDESVDEMPSMQRTLSRIGDHGVTFANSFVNFSLCCPSRSTFLTGLYAHNHQVLANVPPLGGFARFEQLDSSNDLPLWLQAAGYRTGQIGKYLNGYGTTDPTLIPPGWDEFNAASGGVSYYDYKLNENGRLVSFGEDPSSYVDDVITGGAVDFINRRAPGAPPFFLYVAYKAPHVGGPHLAGSRCTSGPEPAPRNNGAFATTPLPRPPSFNEADVSDKPAAIRKLAPLSEAAIGRVTTRYQCELEALQSVDQGVARIVHALAEAGELRNTYVVYQSDNGYFHGQHRVQGGKVRVYEPSIRVPLMIRGPGIPAGVTARDLVINADVAPTIVAASGAKARRTMDGRSLLGVAKHPHRENGRALLIETTGYAAVRTKRYLYVENKTGELELYDLQADPDELQNVAGNPYYAAAQAALAADLATLRSCAGRSCRRPLDLGLHLHYRRGHRPGHRRQPCARSPVTVTVVGGDAGKLQLARLRANDVTVATVTAAPFEATVPPRLLTGRHANRVHAVVDLRDGREVTFDTHFPPLCESA